MPNEGPLLSHFNRFSVPLSGQSTNLDTVVLSALLPLEKDRFYAIDNSVNDCIESIFTVQTLSQKRLRPLCVAPAL